MGLNGSEQVPVVDMTTQDAPQRFAESVHRLGFAALVGHGLPVDTIEEVTTEWGAFFDAGVPDGHRALDGGPWGYHRPAEGLMPDGVTWRDRKDFYHLGLERTLPSGVSTAATEPLRQGMDVARQLLGWLDDAWTEGVLGGRSTSLSSWVSPRQSVMRVQRYLPFDEAPAAGTVRALEHADINLITLLPAPEVGGLQIRPVGGDWITLDHEPGLVIVNIGEMLERASRGYYPATPHRVVVVDPQAALVDRWSLPMFFHPEDDVQLEPGLTAGGFRTSRVEEYRRKGWMVSTGGGFQPDGTAQG